MTPALDPVRLDALRKLAEAALVQGWSCSLCGCLTFARIDEPDRDGYAPGDIVRCVSCKHEAYWPRFNETAATTLALLARIAELEAGEESASRDYDEQPHLLPKASVREERG